MEGNLLRKRNPVTMKRSGIGYLTENRRDEGLFLTLGIDRNITITDIGKILSGPFNHVSRKKSDQIALDTIERLRIRGLPNEPPAVMSDHCLSAMVLSWSRSSSLSCVKSTDSALAIFSSRIRIFKSPARTLCSKFS